MGKITRLLYGAQGCIPAPPGLKIYAVPNQRRFLAYWTLLRIPVTIIGCMELFPVHARPAATCQAPVGKLHVMFNGGHSMRKLVSYGVATTALLALSLSAQPSAAGALVRASGLHFAPGVNSVTLVADDKMSDDKKMDDAKSTDSKPVDDDKAGDTKKTADHPKPHKKKAARRTMSKKDMMGQAKKYVPQEYQGYLSGAGGAGGAGAAGAGGAGGGYGGNAYPK
jgi:hypothetical protein